MTIKDTGNAAGGSSATPSPNNIGQSSSGAGNSSNPKRTHTIMSAEDAAAGKRSFWAEMELTGMILIDRILWRMHACTKKRSRVAF